MKNHSKPYNLCAWYAFTDGTTERLDDKTKKYIQSLCKNVYYVHKVTKKYQGEHSYAILYWC